MHGDMVMSLFSHLHRWNSLERDKYKSEQENSPLLMNLIDSKQVEIAVVSQVDKCFLIASTCVIFCAQ